MKNNAPFHVKKSWHLFQVSSRREKSINKVSYFSFVVYKAYQKDNFYGIKQFVDSSFIERRTAGIDHWLLPFTGYDFTRYDNHTVRLLCPPSWDLRQFRNTVENFHLKSVYNGVSLKNGSSSSEQCIRQLQNSIILYKPVEKAS